MKYTKDHFSNYKMDLAKEILKKANLYQSNLMESNFSNELIDRATPILWFGEVKTNNWVTIATNPSSKEFLDSNGNLLLGEKSRFYAIDEDISFSEYALDDFQLEKTIEMYNEYFNRGTAYTNWFGKKNGAKLEGFLNGLGGSFYSDTNFKNVVHTDFIPIATKSQMSKIGSRNTLFENKFSKEILNSTLNFLNPSLIIILGKEHCARLSSEEEYIFEKPKSVNNFPNAKYQIGFYRPLRTPVIGLHFKPSEQFIGLGGGFDSMNNSHGSYAKRESLSYIGSEIRYELLKFFRDLDET